MLTPEKGLPLKRGDFRVQKRKQWRSVSGMNSYLKKTLLFAVLVGCSTGYLVRKAQRYQRIQTDAKCLEEAINCFENEGGLVVG